MDGFSIKFICGTQVPCTLDKQVNAPYLRKSFILNETPETANIRICGLGFYELYINGTNITKGALAPYISNPDDLCYYDDYEVSQYLKKGENAIGILLGNGFQNPFGGSVWDFDKAKWLGVPRVALSLEVVTASGTVCFEADAGFKTAPSPITFDEYRMGVHYDANLEIEGWSEPGFDDSGWTAAMPAEMPRGDAVLCEAEPIVVTGEIKPVRIFADKNGYTYDFGINIAGLCRLKINGTKGQQIKLRYAEWLRDGIFDYSTVIFDRPTTQFYHEYAQVDKYICKGGETETFVPPFTYHGFQYVYVEGITKAQATEELLTCLVMNSDVKERGGFTCSDETLNTLQEYTRRSDLSNFYYFPTDCPHREKNGWTGDASMSSEHMLMNLTVEHSLCEWLRNVRKAQDIYGALPGIVPTSGWGFKWGNGPAWDSVCVYLPYYIYKYTGDDKVLCDNADMIFKYLNYITTCRDENGLIAIGLGDWVQPRHIGSDLSSPLKFTDTAMVLDMCRKAELIFKIIGRKLQKKFAGELHDDLRTCIRKQLVDLDTMTVVGRCQTSQAVALEFGIFNKEEEDRAFSVLEQIIEEDEEFINTGVIGIRFIFHVLSRYGRTDLAYRMITRPDFPSYGYWLKCGATSLWEDFLSEDVSKGSKNHHFLGDISSWFIQDIAGLKVNPSCRNVDEIEIAPHFIDELDYASAFFISHKGRIEVKWHRVNDRIILELSAPNGIEGIIKLSEGYRFMDGTISSSAKNGTYEIV